MATVFEMQQYLATEGGIKEDSGKRNGKPLMETLCHSHYTRDEKERTGLTKLFSSLRISNAIDADSYVVMLLYTSLYMILYMILRHFYILDCAG